MSFCDLSHVINGSQSWSNPQVQATNIINILMLTRAWGIVKLSPLLWLLKNFTIHDWTKALTFTSLLCLICYVLLIDFPSSISGKCCIFFFSSVSFVSTIILASSAASIYAVEFSVEISWCFLFSVSALAITTARSAASISTVELSVEICC